MHKLSIITINYNNAIGLEKTIVSVVSQSYKNFEYLIIDGASIDESVNTIKNYQEQITYWVSEKDNGIYHAMNKGIERADGEYCLFLNSGDCLADEKVLEKLFFKNYSVDIIYGNMKIKLGNGKIELGKMPKKIGVYQMYRDTLWHPVSFIKRNLFLKYGFYNESFKIVADYEFFVKVIILNKVSTKYVSLFISVFESAGISSQPSNKDEIAKERRRVQDLYFNPLLLFFFRMYSNLKA
jgi:glycosyltransferase involved in cell wall biosynthesis